MTRLRQPLIDSVDALRTTCRSLGMREFHSGGYNQDPEILEYSRHFGSGTSGIRIVASLPVRSGEDVIVRVVWGRSIVLTTLPRIRLIGTMHDVQKRLVQRVRDAQRKAFVMSEGLMCPLCGCPSDMAGRCQNVRCGTSPAKASSRLKAAFGSAHGPMAPAASGTAPGASSRLIARIVTGRLEEEAGVIEEPVMGKEIPVDMRNLF